MFVGNFYGATTEYQGASQYDELAWAKAEMYATTKDATYLDGMVELTRTEEMTGASYHDRGGMVIFSLITEGEDGWDAALENGDKIYAHVDTYKSNGSDRPDVYMGYTVTEHPDGSREWDAFSYQNESAATQEAWADELAAFDEENPEKNPYDNPMNEVYESEGYVNRDDA